MGKAIVIAFALVATWSSVAAQRAPSKVEGSRARLPIVEVFKSPTCGCCSKWIGHMRQHGFTVTSTDLADVSVIKKQHQVPGAVSSCHTALVDGYVVEGHVPATDVLRLLKTRPAVAGIAVPKMPIGSPGMEVEGTKPEPYDVVSFDKQGNTKVFSSHRPTTQR